MAVELAFVAAEGLFEVFVGFDYGARNVEAFTDDTVSYGRAQA